MPAGGAHAAYYTRMDFSAGNLLNDFETSIGVVTLFSLHPVDEETVVMRGLGAPDS